MIKKFSNYSNFKFIAMVVRKPTINEIQETKTWETWEKEPSKFPWYYDDKETCYILEGVAMVRDSKGNQIEFKSGDWVEFEQGLECTWEITKDIRKKYKFG